MKKMKCLMCGCEREFVEISLTTGVLLADAGDVRQSVNAYGCVECGFVQLFGKEQVNKKLEAIKEEEEYNQKLKEYNIEINKTRAAIEETRKIINDENQTVKAVNEAKEKMRELENKLYSIRKPEKRNRYY